MQKETAESGLVELINRGGGFYTIPGASPREVLTSLVERISVPPGVDKQALLSAVLEREALMPTAIGSGIALPHPRNPFVMESGEQFVTIAYPEQAVNWKALDGNPVHTVILIVSASAKLHLHTLSRINFFCHQESFRRLLKNRAPREEIRQAIEEAQQTWDT